MKPALPQGLQTADAAFHSMYGTIASNWKQENGRFSWKIKVPANTTALVYMPARSAAQVKEGAKAATASEGVRFLRMEEGRALFEVGSGEYAFESEEQ
jgi:alpha-L-rhamnosidase